MSRVKGSKNPNKVKGLSQDCYRKACRFCKRKDCTCSCHPWNKSQDVLSTMSESSNSNSKGEANVR